MGMPAGEDAAVDLSFPKVASKVCAHSGPDAGEQVCEGRCTATKKRWPGPSEICCETEQRPLACCGGAAI
jgi:hypothetical protein